MASKKQTEDPATPATPINNLPVMKAFERAAEAKVQFEQARAELNERLRELAQAMSDAAH